MASKCNWSESMIAHCGEMSRFIDLSDSMWAGDMPEKEKTIRTCTIMAPGWNDPDLSKPVFTKEPITPRKEDGGNEVVQLHHDMEATVLASQDDQGSALLEKCLASRQLVQDHLVGTLREGMATTPNAPQGRDDSPTAVHVASPGSANVKGKGREVIFEQDGEAGSAHAGHDIGFRYTLEEQ
ncbi:hypothetical protein FAVG1_12855 [Fusarium avenaceum]|nr:hypothetical protein FAVG1_12855 [Fusarium avenaceum]